jgi:hypothetical protein
MKARAIVVLGDGETWSMVEGASICIISDDELQALCDGDIDPRDLQPMVELLIKDFTPPLDRAP